MRGLDLRPLLVENRESCPELERLDMDGLVIDMVVPARSVFRV